jgi:FtsP/CotA-like multicopper oxidase with cupredoxin domain
MAPDGFSRPMIVFNNQYPGPTIVADWGDTIQINVKNSLEINGTSIHWHGLRQLHSNQMDGTNGITECPIAPGQTKTYTFKATEYGTSWYHSHYSVQYSEGAVGTIVIRGPSSDNWDIDLGAFPMTDWYHQPVFEILASAPRAPPVSQSLLVNGSAVYNGQGQYSKTMLTPGKKHLLRLINTGTNTQFHVSLDNHPFTVIASDFVPVVPFKTSELSLAVGQRYDVIIDANQAVGNYWFRVGSGGGRCDGPNEQATKNQTEGAIFSYIGAPSGNPTSTSSGLTTGCQDVTGIVPKVSFTIPPPVNAPTELALTLDLTGGVFWKVNGQAMHIDWSKPTLNYILNGTFTLPTDDNGLVINDANVYTFWLIQNNTPLPHPIHLHGHDFWQVAVGSGSGIGASLNLNNPTRRDTITVPATGFLIIAFISDNPGVWLMHCHIPFHISGGLGVQFLENPSQIVPTLGDLSGLTQGCQSWDVFAPNVVQPDSGLKKRERAIRQF